jgi:hypothetical protein
MVRIIAVGLVLACLAGYIQYQFRQVIGQVTATKPKTIRPLRIGQPDQGSRTKCIICNGTGRVTTFTLSGPRYAPSPSRPCASCRGTGWVDNPTFGR